MVEGDETRRLSLPEAGVGVGWGVGEDKEERKTGQGGRNVGRGLGLGPHLSRDLVLVIMRKVLELSKDILGSGEGFRPVAPPLLPVLPT